MPADDAPMWVAGSSDPLPEHVTAVRWPDGTVECRYRLLHPAGSLVARDGEQGIALTDRVATCTTCSDACAT